MLKKKILIFLFIFTIYFPTLALADDIDEEEMGIEDLQEITIETVAKSTEEPILNARAAIIYDRTTKEVIWGKNETQKRAMASTTKIMTSIVVLENSNLSDVVTISKKAAGTGGSRLKITAGDKITVQDLLYGLMLRSRKRYCRSISRICRRKFRRICKTNESKGRRIRIKKYSFCYSTWTR